MGSDEGVVAQGERLEPRGLGKMYVGALMTAGSKLRMLHLPWMPSREHPQYGGTRSQVLLTVWPFVISYAQSSASAALAQGRAKGVAWGALVKDAHH